MIVSLHGPVSLLSVHSTRQLWTAGTQSSADSLALQWAAAQDLTPFAT